MLSVLEPYNLPNTESVSLIMYPSDCNTQSPIGTVKRLPKLFLLKLPFNEVNQMAGAARTAPERSPHGLYFIQR